MVTDCSDNWTMSQSMRWLLPLVVVVLCVGLFAGTVGATTNTNTLDSSDGSNDIQDNTQQVDAAASTTDHGLVQYDVDVSKDRVYLLIKADEFGGEIVCYTDTAQCNRLEWYATPDGNPPNMIILYYGAESHLGILVPGGGPSTDGKASYGIRSGGIAIDNWHDVKYMGMGGVSVVANPAYFSDTDYLHIDVRADTPVGGVGFYRECNTENDPINSCI